MNCVKDILWIWLVWLSCFFFFYKIPASFWYALDLHFVAVNNFLNVATVLWLLVSFKVTIIEQVHMDEQSILVRTRFQANWHYFTFVYAFVDYTRR